jgi:hypothetical protein
MGYLEEMAKYHKTQKHKQFGFDFLKAEEVKDYEFWDKIEIGEESEVPIKFEVKAEDMMAYAEGVPDDNPLFNTQVAFFVLRKGHGSWIRTPGARNPGQIIEWYDPIRVGDILTMKLRGYDKWMKRGKYYMRYLMELYDQNGNLKIRSYGTLILPRTREDVLRFVRGEHALEA